MLKLFLKGQVKQEPSHVYRGTDERNAVPSQANDQKESAQQGRVKRISLSIPQGKQQQGNAPGLSLGRSQPTHSRGRP